jgi:hypothetical protein
MLDVAYSYCINVTEEKKLEVDKQVKKNKLEFKCAICLPFIGFLMGQVLLFPVEGVLAQQIVRNARNLSEPANQHNLNQMDEVILVKDYEILPGTEALPLSANSRRRHPHGRPRMRPSKSIDISLPQSIQELENIAELPKVRPFTEVETGLNAKRDCPASKFNMFQEHRTFVKEMKSKGHFVDNFNCDLERFETLSTNPETDSIDRKSINEAKTILQSEQENLVINARRPNLKKGEPNLDFILDGPGVLLLHWIHLLLHLIPESNIP